MDLSPSDFAFFREAIHQRAGISLSPAKVELVKTRLRARIRALGLDSFAAYRSLLEDHSSAEEWQAFINSLTTNKTDFFREPQHFEFLQRNILPAWAKNESRQFKLWCAAASTGEEPYTLSLTMQNALPAGNYQILATDIDTNVLRTASNGVYPLAKLGDIPLPLQKEGTETGRGEISSWFRMGESARKKITFERHNLMDESIPASAPFDAIFCRNVFIYFTPASIQKIVGKFHSALLPGGHLIIGHSEGIQQYSRLFQQVQPSIFRKLE